MRSSIGAATDELVDEHVPLLPDAEGAVGGLVLDRGVPPAIEVDDVRGRRQVQPRAARLEREDEERGPCLVLERVDQRLALLDRHRPVQHEPFAAEDARRGRRASGAVISRNWVKTSTFSCRGGDRLADLAQARELAARVRGPDAVAQPVRRVVADLLEPQERREDGSAPLDALALLERPRQVVHRTLVERGLRPG